MMTAELENEVTTLPEIEFKEVIPLPKIKGIPAFVYQNMTLPESIEEAKERIIDHMCSIDQIRDQLSFNDREDDDWRRRAGSAMAINHYKIYILRRWIALNQFSRSELQKVDGVGYLIDENKKLKNRVAHLECELIKLKESTKSGYSAPKELKDRLLKVEQSYDDLATQFCNAVSNVILREIGDAWTKGFVKSLMQSIETINISKFRKRSTNLDNLRGKVSEWLERIGDTYQMKR